MLKVFWSTPFSVPEYDFPFVNVTLTDAPTTAAISRLKILIAATSDI
jgi:hypothetical protein